MSDHRHYVPILKGRKGEFLALSETSESRRDRMTPLIEVPPVPWDFEHERPAKSLDAHLDPVAANVLRHWGDNRRVLIDLAWISDDPTEAGTHPVTKVLSDLRQGQSQAIPVAGPSRSDVYWSAVVEAVQQDGRGCCIRLEPDDLRRLNALHQLLEAACERLALPADDVDLILDFKGFDPGQTAAIEIAAAAGLAALPSIEDWRSVTLAGGAFPLNLSGLSGESVIPRADWDVWRSVTSAQREEGVRQPQFGDYAVQHPEPDEIDPRLMKMSAAIRYATSTEWLVLKGRNVQDYGWEQFHDLSADLVGRPEFIGAEFSSGDQGIDACAKREAGTGNAMTWRKLATNHHLAVVVDQLASLP